MKVLKILLGLIAVVLIAAVVVFAVFFSNINQIVKDVVEEQGTKVAGVPVSLMAADIAIQNGRGQLNGLQIANPKGYTTPYALNMGSIVLELDTSSVIKNSKVKVIKNVSIDGAKLIAEQSKTEFTMTNLQQLADNLAKTSTAKQDVSATKNSAPDVKLMVENFKFSNSNVRLVTQDFGERTIKLPEIKLSNIGDKKTGLTPEQLSQAMIEPILAQVTKHVQNELKEIAKDKLEDKLKKNLEKSLLKKLGGDDKAKDTVNKLKSLFSK